MDEIKTETENSSSLAEQLEVKRARLATVRSRNLALSHLDVPNRDPSLEYEWVHNDRISRLKKENLGFHVVKEAVSINGLDANGENVAGDVVLMAIPKEDKILIDQIDYEEYKRRHGVSGDSLASSQSEEKEFDNNAKRAGLTIVEESSTKNISGNEVKSILSKGN